MMLLDLALCGATALALALGPSGATGAVGLVGFLARRPGPRAELRNGPRVYFRVVTRGVEKELLSVNAAHLVRVLGDGLASGRFVLEYATDRALDLPAPVVQHVVPETWTTPKGSLHKARALHYALAKSTARDGDWVVHLDEESLLREDTLRAITRWIEARLAAGRPDDVIGQGAVAYAGGLVHGWGPTLVDAQRVAWDVGGVRFMAGLGILVLAKGSFLVVSQVTERGLAWDMTPDFCLTEDDGAVVHYPRPLSGDFIDAFMHEGSPLTLHETYRQRRRWILGLRRVMLSGASLATKANFSLMFLGFLEGAPWAVVGALWLAGVSLAPVTLALAAVLLACHVLHGAVGGFYNTQGSGRPLLERLAIAAASTALVPLVLLWSAAAWCRVVPSAADTRFEVVRKRALVGGK